MKHLSSSLSLLSLAAASLLTSGCITITDSNFLPFGSEVTVSGEWDVDGAAPNLTSCGDIATVRALVCETSSGSNCLSNTRLTFACTAGAFDTRPSGLLVTGTYYIVWEALNSSGTVLQASNPTRLDAYGSHAILPIPDFAPGTTAFDPSGTAVSLDGIWDVNGAEPTLASCGDIATVRVVICENAAATTCWTAPSLTFPCANGEFDTRPTRVLRAGSYYSLWEALDSSGNVLQETTPLQLVVTSVSHATLATPDFDGALPPTTVTVQMRFENNAGGPFVTCSAAAIATNQFTYTLREGTLLTDPIISGPTNQSCSSGSDVLFSDNGSFAFDGEAYSIYVHAEENVNSCISLWDAKCTFTLSLNTSNVVTCNVDVVSSGAGC